MREFKVGDTVQVPMKIMGEGLGEYGLFYGGPSLLWISKKALSELMAEKTADTGTDAVQRAIEVLEALRMCEIGDCNENCEDCRRYTIPSGDLISAYKTAIAALQEKQRIDELRQKGRLVELPCAIGDFAYWISDEDKEGNRVPTVRKTTPIKGIAVEEDGWYIRTEEEYDKVGERWAYLTSKDAQEALEALQEKNKNFI